MTLNLTPSPQMSQCAGPLLPALTNERCQELLLILFMVVDWFQWHVFVSEIWGGFVSFPPSESLWPSFKVVICTVCPLLYSCVHIKNGMLFSAALQRGFFVIFFPWLWLWFVEAHYEQGERGDVTRVMWSLFSSSYNTFLLMLNVWPEVNLCSLMSAEIAVEF